MIKPALFTSHLDRWLFSDGFSRASHNPRYVRKIGATAQRIDIVLQGAPRGQRDAVAAVYPQMQVQIPALDVAMKAMLGETASGCLNQPIDFTSNKRQRGWWLVRSEADVESTSTDIGQFIKNWTLPFLDQYISVSDVRDAELRRDGRILRDRNQMLRGVAAILLTAGPAAALDRLHELLGAPGLRTQYARAFDYLEKRRLH